MSTKQIDTVEDRLAKRRNARNKRFQDKNSIDEFEITLISTRPKTRSLDRLPKKSSPIQTKNAELPPIRQSYVTQNYFFSNEKTHSSPVLEQVTKSSSVDAEDEKQTSTNSLSNNEKPVILKESVAVIPIQETIHDKPIVTKEPVASIALRQTNCYSTPQSLSNQLNKSDSPESVVYTREKHFNYPSVHSKPLQRAASEQAVSSHQSKLVPLNSIFAKQNALALPYLFNKRLIEAEFSRGTSLDSTHIQQKTAWD